jgi:hypothetical protein
VVARAPRLHGQKVWKKVSVKLAHVEDRQDEAQEELLKEGGGARKRSRAMGARENICDAIWVDDAPGTTAKDIRTYFDHDGKHALRPVSMLYLIKFRKRSRESKRERSITIRQHTNKQCSFSKLYPTDKILNTPRYGLRAS